MPRLSSGRAVEFRWMRVGFAGCRAGCVASGWVWVQVGRCSGVSLWGSCRVLFRRFRRFWSWMRRATRRGCRCSWRMWRKCWGCVLMPGLLWRLRVIWWVTGSVRLAVWRRMLPLWRWRPGARSFWRGARRWGCGSSMRFRVWSWLAVRILRLGRFWRRSRQPRQSAAGSAVVVPHRVCRELSGLHCCGQ